MQNKLTNIKLTDGGYEVKDLRYIEVDYIIVGMVKDPVLGNPNLREGFVSCQWNKHGFPIRHNKGKTDLKLEIPK